MTLAIAAPDVFVGHDSLGTEGLGSAADHRATEIFRRAGHAHGPDVMPA